MYAVQLIYVLGFFCFYLYNVCINECTFDEFDKPSLQLKKKKKLQIYKYKSKQLLWIFDSEISAFGLKKKFRYSWNSQFSHLFRPLKCVGGLDFWEKLIDLPAIDRSKKWSDTLPNGAPNMLIWSLKALVTFPRNILRTLCHFYEKKKVDNSTLSTVQVSRK